MFKFLKEKLKGAISKIGKDVAEDESNEEDAQEVVEEPNSEVQEERGDEATETVPEDSSSEEESGAEKEEPLDELTKESTKESADEKPEEQAEEPTEEDAEKEDVSQEAEKEVIGDEDTPEKEKDDSTIDEPQDSKEIVSEESEDTSKEDLEKTAPDSEEEKKSEGFFSKIKKAFVKSDEPSDEKDANEVEKVKKNNEAEGDSSQDTALDKVTEEAAEKEDVEDALKEATGEPSVSDEDKKSEKTEEVSTEDVSKKGLRETETKDDVDDTSEPDSSKEAVEETKEEEKGSETKHEDDKKGFFGGLTQRLTTTKIDNEKFEKLFWDLELAMLENNVAVEVIEHIKEDLERDLVDTPIKRSAVVETIESSLKSSITGLFSEHDFDLLRTIKSKDEGPYVVVFVGINGSGKTTSIAKMAHMLKEKGLNIVIGAGDTFRAASIEQLQQHGDKLGIKVIKHDYGSDPAAVAFDTIKHAQAKGADVVLVDTAGRMHSNKNLVDEMKKIVRVAKPDLTLFVGESITGNDCVEQAKSFNDAVGIDGIILSKVDIDEKGGAAVSVSYVTKKPILYIGTGQEYGDLQEFSSDTVVSSLGLA